MGCKSSKATPARVQSTEKPQSWQDAPYVTADEAEPRPNAAEFSVSSPEGRAGAGARTAAAANLEESLPAPAREPTRASTTSASAMEVDENAQLPLPKGVWIRTEGTPYYYSAMENLYYHPPSRQFFDPSTEMWYDSDTNEWYRDEDDANNTGPTQVDVCS